MMHRLDVPPDSDYKNGDLDYKQGDFNPAIRGSASSFRTDNALLQPLVSQTATQVIAQTATPATASNASSKKAAETIEKMLFNATIAGNVGDTIFDPYDTLTDPDPIPLTEEQMANFAKEGSLVGVSDANVNSSPCLMQYAGNYGPLNKLRYEILKATTPMRFLIKLLSDAQVAQLINEEQGIEAPTAGDISAYRKKVSEIDLNTGTTLNDVATRSSYAPGENQGPQFNLIAELEALLAAGNPDITQADIDAWKTFLSLYGHNPANNIVFNIKPNAKEGIQAFTKIEISHMQNETEKDRPCLDALGVKLREGQGSYGVQKQLLEFLFSALNKEVMEDPKYAVRFEAEAIRKAVDQELDLSMITRKATPEELAVLRASRDTDKDPLTPEEMTKPITAQELYFVATPGSQRIKFWFLHGTKFYNVCEVMPIQRVNAGKETLKQMRGTTEEAARKFAQKQIAKQISIVGLQECGQEDVEALKQVGYHNVKEHLPKKADRVGTTLLLHRDFFLIETIKIIEHSYFDDKKRQNKLLMLIVISKTKRLFFIVNGHADAAKGKTADVIAKLTEADNQFLRVRELPEYKGKQMERILLGDLNIKSKPVYKQLVDFTLPRHIAIFYMGDSTRKFRLFGNQVSKLLEYAHGYCGAVMTELSQYKIARVRIRDGSCVLTDLLPNSSNTCDHDETSAWFLQSDVADGLLSKSHQPTSELDLTRPWEVDQAKVTEQDEESAVTFHIGTLKNSPVQSSQQDASFRGLQDVLDSLDLLPPNSKVGLEPGIGLPDDLSMLAKEPNAKKPVQSQSSSGILEEILADAFGEKDSSEGNESTQSATALEQSKQPDTQEMI